MTHLRISEPQFVFRLFQDDVNVLRREFGNPGGRMSVSAMLREVAFQVLICKGIS